MSRSPFSSPGRMLWRPGKGMLRGDNQAEIIGVQQHRVETAAGQRPFHHRQIQLVQLHALIKIVYGVRNNIYMGLGVLVAVQRQHLRHQIFPRRWGSGPPPGGARLRRGCPRSPAGPTGPAPAPARAYLIKTAPSGVGTSSFLSGRKMGMPYSASSCRMWWLTAGWVRCKAAAAV